VSALFGVVLLSGALVGVTAAGGSAASSFVDMDCADFATQADAQAFFLANDPVNDPHQLDGDDDMIACEYLPCPCSYDTTPSPTPSPTTAPPTPTSTPTSSPSPTATVEPKPRRDRARVVRVVDGDTVKVRIDGRNRRVRMLGLDSPEMPGECGAKTATRMLTAVLPPTTVVRLISDVTQPRKDRYGRLLRYLHVLRTNTDMSLWQIRHGNAEVLVVGDEFTRFGRYTSAQDAAKAHQRGIWGACR